MRTTEEVIADLKALVWSPGYVYSLCILLFEEFHINPSKIHEQRPREQLSMNEALVVVGILSQREIDFSEPESPEILVEKKQRTKKLLEELQKTYLEPFLSSMQRLMEDDPHGNVPSTREVFGVGKALVEPIHYAGTGAYDFQLLKMIEPKYKYDTEWLLQNRGFTAPIAKDFFEKVKSCLEEKSQRVNLYVREIPEEILAEVKERYPGPPENADMAVAEYLEMIKLHQYVDLFEFTESVRDDSDLETTRKRSWTAFCKNLIDLFVVTPADVEGVVGSAIMLELFSFAPSATANAKFQTIGSYNQCRSHPLLKISPGRFFLPITFMLAEALYESPYYWMAQDRKYFPTLGKNRGNAGEEIVFDLLAGVFGRSRTFRSVQVQTKKGHIETDIDVLCLLGTKAVCVQVKSQKLTELSRTGNDAELEKNFQAAVQDAFEQGKSARGKILSGGAKFLDSKRREIEGIDHVKDVYLLVVTTENYPSLAHQARILLKRELGDPLPMVLTIFDLELVAHYLTDPYEFLYYVKQRTSFADHFIGDEESAFLGFHLMHKLWKEPECDLITIDSSYSLIIDQHYYPLNRGIEVSSENNPLLRRWKDEKFERFVGTLARIPHPKITDIVFHLFEMSGNLRKSLIDLVETTRDKTRVDGKSHDFSIPPDEAFSPKIGFTYMSSHLNDPEDLAKRLEMHVGLRKYKSKGDIWIGFGSLKDSPLIIDMIAINEQPWRHSEKLEHAAQYLKGQHIKVGKKT